MDARRIFSGFANLASNYDCLHVCSFRDMTFFVIKKNSVKLIFFEKDLIDI